MANIFSGKKATSEKVEDDFLGGGGVFDTDIYTAKIKTVYIGKAQNSNAQSINLILDIGGKELRNTIWVTNKQGEVTYKDKKTGEPKNLPGFNQVNSLAMLVAGKEMGDLDVEELKVKIYDFDAKAEVPQAVDCFTELHGETIQIALQRQTVDKTQKNEATGDYDPTGETRDVNEIVKFFPGDKLVTISEVDQFIKSLGSNLDEVMENGELLKAIAKMPEEQGTYAEKWLEKNRGQTWNKSSGKAAEGKSFAGKAKTSGGASSGKAKTLFDD
jgi:hypothetical protein